MCEIDALSDLRNVVLRMIELIRKGESLMKEQGRLEGEEVLKEKIEGLKSCGDVTIAQAAGIAFN